MPNYTPVLNHDLEEILDAVRNPFAYRESAKWLYEKMAKKYGLMKGQPSKDINLLERAKLAQKVYMLALDNTDDFEEDDVGLHLSYLLGSILTGGKMELFLDVEGHKQALSFFKDTFVEDDQVWAYIDVHEKS